MGRKVEMKKIENITKCQVTFSKRRSSLMKKAHEISVCCDVDVAFVAFSPSGRITKFCSQSRIENVLHRYVNLSPDKRYTHIRNVEEKQDKLRQFDHIKGETGKLQYLDKQIENLELQIKKSTLELQILEAELRDYEPHPEQEPSLHQLLWCDRNLKQSYQRVMARRNALLGGHSSLYRQPSVQMHQREMGNRDSVPLSYNFDVRESNPAAGGFLMQLDPWISPYSAKVRETIFQDLLDQAKRMPIGDQARGTSTNRISNLPITGFPATTDQSRNSSSTPKTNVLPTYNTTQGRNRGHRAPFGVQPDHPTLALGHQGDMLGSTAPFGVVGQHLNSLNREYGVVPMVQFNSNREQGQSFSFIQPDLEIQRAGKGLNLDGVLSRQVQLGLEISEPKTDQMITGSKWLNLNQTHPLKDLKSTGQPSGECSNSNSNSTSSNSDSNNKSNKSHGDHANEEHSPAVNPPIEHTEDSLYANPPFEVNWGDDRLWTSGIQESGLWEWDDLVIADNLNVEDLDNF